MEITWIDKDSDGIVLTESQLALPKPTLTGRVHSNSSHMQIRNNEEIRTSLIDLFENNLKQNSNENLSGAWFTTPTQ